MDRLFFAVFPDTEAAKLIELACCRFREHQDWVFHEAGSRPFERFYNAVRRHSTLVYRSPVDLEKEAGLA